MRHRAAATRAWEMSALTGRGMSRQNRLLCDVAIFAFALTTEPVHEQGPLQADGSTFNGLQQEQRHHNDHRTPYSHMSQQRKVGGGFHAHESRNHNVADNENRQIGWQVIGALFGVILATDGAMIDRLHKGTKQPAFAAMRAAALEASPQRLLQITGRTRGFWAFAAENLDMTICRTGL